MIKEHELNGDGFPNWTLHVPEEHIGPGLEINFHTSAEGLHIADRLIPWGALLVGLGKTFDKDGLPQVYRVGEFWSSSNPNKAILSLAVGAGEITSHEKHRSFIRWVTPYEVVTVTKDRTGAVNDAN